MATQDMAEQFDIVHLKRVGSTQDEVSELLSDRSSPVLVVADEQSVGRGRQGREWVQPDRGMTASYGFISEWGSDELTLLPLIAAVAMSESIRGVFGLHLGLRWPNDLILGGLKVGGLLVEVSGDAVVVGCGVNLWWGEPAEGACSLLDSDPGPEAGLLLSRVWAEAFVAHIERGSERWPRREYEEASVTLNRDVVWGGGSGRAVAIANDGALVVELNGEVDNSGNVVLVELRAGEVHTRDQD